MSQEGEKDFRGPADEQVILKTDQKTAVSALKHAAHQCDLWSMEQVWRRTLKKVNISEANTFNYSGSTN